MSNAADIDTKQPIIWSTWEELLLAFAVKRHGLRDWDTVATELQNRHRSSFPPSLFTPQICRDKYRLLRRRFTNHRHTTTTSGGDGGGSEDNEFAQDIQSDDDDDDENDGIAFPWLEELRKLRVAELKQEVHRRDLSIRSLQMKVKTMEEEREERLKEDRNDDAEKPDLDVEEVKEERSENDKNDEKDKPEAEVVAGKYVSGDDESMSFNESNSTENRRTGLEMKPEEVKPESELKPVGEEDSCNDSSDRHEVARKASQEKDESESGDELRDSVDESKEITKESSDVQSSESYLTRKRKRIGEVDGGEGAAVLSPVTARIKREGEEGTVKSEPSASGGGFGFLDKIRAHEHGSVFESRLESQNTEKYNNTIRRHVDLETVQAHIDDGSYSLYSTKFYVDLLLIFTNAIVFFPKSSPEYLAAEELRELIMNEVKKITFDPSPEPAPVPVPVLVSVPLPIPETVSIKPKPKSELERSDSLLAQHKSTAPIIVSRKRSSISAKASSSSNAVEKHQADDKPFVNSKPINKSPSSTSNEEEDSMKLKVEEKPVTRVRSTRSSKGRLNISKPKSTPNTSNNKSSISQQPSSKDKGEAAKVDKKKSAAAATNKKSGAADFLKRMKKNSPVKGTLVESLKNSRDSSSKGGKKDPKKKKVDERKDGPPKRSGGGGGGGGGGRKHAKEESSPTKRNTGRSSKKGKDVVVTGGKRRREGGGEGQGSSKRPKKRSR
ncbi:hypothetical protein ACH5RR_000662 [Cinchona calisaya]|uniref:Bromo domain-containing protein n=1 Tax=Cinchona calisaya TaxID=153742 RepID=A0ABD3B1J6_9GENT